MRDVKKILSDLSAIISPPSGEAKVAEYIREFIKETVPNADISEDALGTLTVALKGESGRTVMFTASTDESVFAVNDADAEGRIRFASLGDLSVSAAAYCEAEFENGVRGTVVPLERCDTLPDDPLKYGVDIGAKNKEEALSKAAPGTAFRPSSTVLVNGDAVTGPSVAAKAGVAVLLGTAAALSGRELKNTVLLTFASQGKVGARSAGPAAVALRPDAAVSVVAVPENSLKKIPLGGGPVAVATSGPVVADPRVRDALGLPVAVTEPTRVQDDGIAAARFLSKGVPAGIVGIPARYAGTARETVNACDVAAAAKALSEFVNGEF
jgi:endoglucanase